MPHYPHVQANKGHYYEGERGVVEIGCPSSKEFDYLWRRLEYGIVLQSQVISHLVQADLIVGDACILVIGRIPHLAPP